MTSSTAVHGAILEALTEAGIYAVIGPAESLPRGEDGLIAQAAVLYPAAPAHDYSRASGDSSGRRDRVTVVCVGATVLDALAVADKVEAAIGGTRPSSTGGTLHQITGTTPTLEPNTDPARVSMSVEYVTVTKG